jgi:3-oxoacyl-[acyl-carrier protein] reductase
MEEKLMGKERLTDKVAIVTGSGRGIGEAIARVFADEGAKVVVATRTEKYGQATVDRIRAAGGEALLLVVEIGDVETDSRVVDTTVDHYGTVNIMVHNAMATQYGPIESYTEEDLEASLSVNLKSCWRLSSACIPHFRKNGGGRLLFTSSVTGPRVVMPGLSYYASGKGGMNAFIRAAAIELARDKITVNGVEPGMIRTPSLETLADEEGLQQMTKYLPMGYIGDPEDIAYAMLYLASDEARYVTGQTIIVDGGEILPESPVFMEDTEGVMDLSDAPGSVHRR